MAAMSPCRGIATAWTCTGRDDFAGQDRLVRTLSRDRAKDMASDYEQRDPVQNFADRRGITFRARLTEIVRKIVPEKVRERIDGFIEGLRSPGADANGRNAQPEKGGAEATRRETDPPERKVAEDPEQALRRARTKALVRHARAVDTIFSADDVGRKASPEQWNDLTEARRAFAEVRPHGWQDAEAAYAKDGDLAREAGSGRVIRAIRALQLEAEIRNDPNRRADRFVELWQKLDRTSGRQYQAGDMSGYQATRSAMGDMAKSLERDPQLESILAGRTRELGISMDFDSGRSLGRELAFTHGLGIGRGRDIGI